MSSLHLTREQANHLAVDLAEYLKFKDSSNRELFEGFRIDFDDALLDECREEGLIRLQPSASYTEISPE